MTTPMTTPPKTTSLKTITHQLGRNTIKQILQQSKVTHKNGEIVTHSTSLLSCTKISSIESYMANIGASCIDGNWYYESATISLSIFIYKDNVTVLKTTKNPMFLGWKREAI